MSQLLAIFALFASGSAAFAYQQGFNCGGTKTRTMGDGVVYTKDRAYSQTNGSGYVGGQAVQPDLLARLNPLGGIVPGVQARNIVSSRRVGWQEYRFDLPQGRYLVSFHFMEWSQHWSGVRVFDIEVEGEVLLDDFDIFGEVDRLYALNLRRVVDVDDGSLNIIARAIEEESLLAALHVESVVDDGIAPAVPWDVAVVPGYAENVLTWTTDYDRDQLGVAVLRSTDGGPEEIITPDPVVATRHVDSGLEPGRDYSYRLVAIDAAGSASAPSSMASGAPLSSDQSDLLVYGFEMAQEDLIWLNTHRQSDDYLPALFWTLDDLWPNARVRYRGNTSRSNVKKNHKIRVDSPLPSGHDVLNLQAARNFKLRFLHSAKVDFEKDESLMREGRWRRPMWRATRSRAARAIGHGPVHHRIVSPDWADLSMPSREVTCQVPNSLSHGLIEEEHPLRRRPRGGRTWHLGGDVHRGDDHLDGHFLGDERH